MLSRACASILEVVIWQRLVVSFYEFVLAQQLLKRGPHGGVGQIDATATREARTNCARVILVIDQRRERVVLARVCRQEIVEVAVVVSDFLIIS